MVHCRERSPSAATLSFVLTLLVSDAPVYAQVKASVSPSTSENSATPTRSVTDAALRGVSVQAQEEAAKAVPMENSLVDAGDNPLTAARPLIDRVDVAARFADDERKQVYAALLESCREGQLDSCFVALDLESQLALVGSDTRPADVDNLDRQARSLLELCKMQNRAACEKLGTLAFIYDDSEYTEVAALRRGQGLERTIREALAGDPRYRQNAEALSAHLATRTRIEISAEEMATLANACREGSSGACFIGGRFNWSPLPQNGKALDNGRPTAAANAKELMRLCPRYVSVCASAYWKEYQVSGDEDRYDAHLQELCGRQDAEACRMLADRVSFKGDAKATQDAYVKACHLGSASACGTLVETMLNLGETQRALTYALASCHPSRSYGCEDLLKKFQPSELGTLNAHDLSEYACAKGYRRACHQLGVDEYRTGEILKARRRFGAMCVNEQDLRACRYAAQIEWVRGARARAASLLESGCWLHKQVDTCLDLASVYQAQSEPVAASQLTSDWCKRAKEGLGLGPDDPQACRLQRRFQSGWRPATISEIFSAPVDGSEYVGAP